MAPGLGAAHLGLPGDTGLCAGLERMEEGGLCMGAGNWVGGTESPHPQLHPPHWVLQAGSGTGPRLVLSPSLLMGLGWEEHPLGSLAMAFGGTLTWSQWMELQPRAPTSSCARKDPTG